MPAQGDEGRRRRPQAAAVVGLTVSPAHFWDQHISEQRDLPTEAPRQRCRVGCLCGRGFWLTSPIAFGHGPQLTD